MNMNPTGDKRKGSSNDPENRLEYVVSSTTTLHLFILFQSFIISLN